MENLQILYTLFNQSSIFATVSLGIFFVFICGITKPLLYLAGERASFLFDSSGVTNYIAKSASPEPVRLKILFLSFPQKEKKVLYDYLAKPIEKPSKAFSKTLEQLRCEILPTTNYNKNVALLFCILSAITMLISSTATIETKIAGMLCVALVLFCIDWFCNALATFLKYISYKSFKHALCKLDEFHINYNAKYKCGLLPQQTSNSPFLKDAMEATSKPSQSFSPQPISQTLSQKTQIFEKRPHQIPQADISQNRPQIIKLADSENPPQIYQPSTLGAKPQISQAPQDAKEILEKIKVATDNLDFECFQVLSSHLAKMATNPNISHADHKALQDQLDRYLAEFRSANPIA